MKYFQTGTCRSNEIPLTNSQLNRLVIAGATNSNFNLASPPNPNSVNPPAAGALITGSNHPVDATAVTVNPPPTPALTETTEIVQNSDEPPPYHPDDPPSYQENEENDAATETTETSSSENTGASAQQNPNSRESDTS